MADDLKDVSKENINSHFITSKEIIKYEPISKNHPIFEDDESSNSYSKISEGIDS